MADPDFLAARLAVELGDADMARELAALLEADTLCWTAPTIPAARIRTIIGFTFGNRMAANGNRLPGPVNEALAEVAVALHRETNAPIYAQWEVAEPAAERLPPDTVMTARRLGFDAYAPEGHAMPRDYDPLSGQAWCRSRLAYLLHDLMIRITERRAEVLARGQPRHP